MSEGKILEQKIEEHSIPFSDFGQPKQEPKITIEIRPGRWGKIFHLFDTDGREIALQQKDAVKVAKQILKEQNK